ncbi:MAG: MATE family efflux transporter [Candidatus Tectimicrobiota bacterium]
MHDSTPATRVRRLYAEATALLTLGAPLIGAQLAQIAVYFVDTVMAGHLSAHDLAAVAIGGQVFGTVWVTAIGILTAVAPAVAHRFGAQQYADVGACVRQALWLSQFVALVALLVLRGAAPLLRWMAIEPAIQATTLGYIQAIAWGLPAVCAFQVLRACSEGVSKTAPIFYISLLGLLGNIVGNTLFMYGGLGLPRLGAVGCGVASAIVMWLMLAMMLLYTATAAAFKPLQLFARAEWPRLQVIWPLVRLGLPIGVSLCMEGGLFTAVALLMGSLGQTVVAGHQIAINVAAIAFMVPLGLALAITVRVGQAMGRGAPGEARFAGRVGIGLAGLFMALSALLMATCAPAIAGIYSRDPEVSRMAVSLLSLAALFQISDGLQVAGAGALRGLQDTRLPMLITVTAYWVIGLPLGYLLGIVQARGPQAIWVGIIAGLTVAAVLLNSRFYMLTRSLRPAQPVPVTPVPGVTRPESEAR